MTLKKTDRKGPVVMGQGRCPHCNVQLGSAIWNWENHDCLGVKNLLPHVYSVENITEEETEGNKLIEGFLNRNKSIKRINISIPTRYNKDWNELMKAIDLIDSYGYSFEICNNQARIYDKELNGFHRERLFPHAGKTNIEASWKTIVDFIEFYNKDKNDN